MNTNVGEMVEEVMVEEVTHLHKSLLLKVDEMLLSNKLQMSQLAKPDRPSVKNDIKNTLEF